jgi:hypothetical protein
MRNSSRDLEEILGNYESASKSSKYSSMSEETDRLISNTVCRKIGLHRKFLEKK